MGLPPPTLYFASDPGDPLGQGQTFTLGPADGTMAISASQRGADVTFTSSSDPAPWSLHFAAPAVGTFVPGAYDDAEGYYPRSPIRPSLSVIGHYVGCGGFGRFVVLEIRFGPAGELQVLAIDYEMHCNGIVPALFGSVRYNSLLGLGPRLSVAPATSYEGDGEPKSLVFRISLSARAAVPVAFDFATDDGTASGGTDYASTAGPLAIPAGQTTAQVLVPILGNHVAQPDRRMKLVLANATGAPLAFASADGTILDDDTARTFLDVVSDPGEPIGGGRAVVLTPLDGAFNAWSTPESARVRFPGRRHSGRSSSQRPPARPSSPGSTKTRRKRGRPARRPRPLT